MKVRIGIDVGGTFTDAAVINNETFELIGTIKVPTTHTAPEGVAKGIIEVLQFVMAKYDILPDDVKFIAHGTTQATNALLEGDVVKVGILTVGSGLEGLKSKNDTVMGNIKLTPQKFLNTANQYLDTANLDEQGFARKAADLITRLTDDECRSIVAAEAFSVDDPQNENRIMAQCAKLNIPCTATNEISKLYGLKVRTRTAVVNASILPKMLEAATMTETSIKKAGIKSPLMVMRCDGGVMTVEEVRKRPILTILSGPAAGVAGALMYEKLTDGIFFEVGGTSTDISCVKDGKVMVKYAEVGGHKTYLNSLDVRTVGIGGGSMIQIKDGKILDVGPRSAHIAGLDYEIYTQPENIVDPVVKIINPTASDPDYAYIECSNGQKFALTLAGAANIAGFVKPEDYAYGNVEAAQKAWAPLAAACGLSVEQAAAKVLELSAVKNSAVAKALIKDYKMDPRTTMFIGGGGGASVVVPHLAKVMGHKSRNAKNAAVISTIGVALAMVRDMVERTIPNPTEQDIVAVRREAELLAMQSGAAPGSIEISVEVDTQRNLVRATAVGTTELRAKNLGGAKLDQTRLFKIVADNLNTTAQELRLAAENGGMFAVVQEKVNRKLFGLVKQKICSLRLIDDEGVIRLQKNNALVCGVKASAWESALKHLLEELTEYNDGGKQLPNLYIVFGKQIINLSGLASEDQILSIAGVELGGAQPEEKLIVIGTKRVDA